MEMFDVRKGASKRERARERAREKERERERMRERERESLPNLVILVLEWRALPSTNAQVC